MRCLPRTVLLSILLLVLGVDTALSMELVDQAGRTVIIPDRPQRVISLAPNLTEIIFDLGRGSLLVGVTRFSNFPVEAAALPKVGSYIQPDLEKIVSLEPDLCLAIKEGNPQHLVEKLAGLGIPVYVVDPHNLEEIMLTVRDIGMILGADGTAATMVDKARARIGEITARVNAQPGTPSVFFQIDTAPIISAGSNTFIGELIVLAGGINLAAGGNAYPRYSWEDLLRLQPEVVVMTSMAGGLSPGELIAMWRNWPQVPAVRNNRVHVVRADLFNRATLRLVEGLAELADLIHPAADAGIENQGN